MNNEKGFTIVEAVVAATLMAMLFTGGYYLYQRSLEDWYWTDRQAEVQDNLRIGVEKIVYDVRLATSITEPPTDGKQGTVLTIYQGANDITYYRDGTGELQRGDQPVTTGVVTAVNFSRTELNLVNITISGRSPENPELPVITVRTAAYARLAP